MPKYFKLGSMTVETRSMLVGLVVSMVGLSIPQTQSFFNKILSAFKSFVGGIFKK